MSRSAQLLLPDLFGPSHRAAMVAGLSVQHQIRAVSAGLCKIIDAIGRRDTGCRATLDDRRARVANAIITALSLKGAPLKLESFRMLVAVATKARRERGAAGPGGQLLVAALLLADLVLEPTTRCEIVAEAADAGVAAMVMHAASLGHDPRQIRAEAERLLADQAASLQIH